MNFSTNPITGQKLTIPQKIDDKKKIDSFALQHQGKKVVVVQGLGFVGSVMSLVVCNALTEEYAVIGVDRPSPQSYWKICSLNDGVFPLVAEDKKIYEYFEESKRKKNFLATADDYAYSKADVIVIDINLDVKKKHNKKYELVNFDVDMEPFSKSVKTIAKYCKKDVLVLVETTVPPGTCQKIVKPVLDKAFKTRNLTPSYKLAHSYERVMPGKDYVDSIQNFYRVYSGIDKKSASAAEKFLKTVISTEKYPLTRLKSTSATEMAKVLENSYRAMNISFVQEWTAFAENAKVDINEVIDAIRLRPTHQNLMKPGLGVGGYCLTKDPLLASWSSSTLFKGAALNKSIDAVKTNDLMPAYSISLLEKHYGKKIKAKKVLILGVSYIRNIGDTRYTPVQYVYDYLNKEGADITLFDPFVNVWEENKCAVNTSFAAIAKQKYDLIFMCTAHDFFAKDSVFNKWLPAQKNAVIVDTNIVLGETQVSNLLKNNIKLIAVGRGDLL